ncbi:5844_t:CDS:2 [Entrophospora sp. SA101]|nr:5844_t:CDS:2 [Entrophospora sp. SA101]
MIKIDLQFCPNNLCIPATSTPSGTVIIAEDYDYDIWRPVIKIDAVQFLQKY